MCQKATEADRRVPRLWCIVSFFFNSHDLIMKNQIFGCILQGWWTAFSSTGRWYLEVHLPPKIRPLSSSVPKELPAVLSPTPGQGSVFPYPYPMVTPAKTCHLPGSQWSVSRCQSTWSFPRVVLSSLPGGWGCTMEHPCTGFPAKTWRSQLMQGGKDSAA